MGIEIVVTNGKVWLTVGGLRFGLEADQARDLGHSLIDASNALEDGDREFVAGAV